MFADHSQFERIIREIYDCEAAFRGAITFQEYENNERLWAGVVYIFTVNHPEATTCYAWESPDDAPYDHGRVYHVVLNSPTIKNVRDAVRSKLFEHQEHR